MTGIDGGEGRGSKHERLGGAQGRAHGDISKAEVKLEPGLNSEGCSLDKKKFESRSKMYLDWMQSERTVEKLTAKGVKSSGEEDRKRKV